MKFYILRLTEKNKKLFENAVKSTEILLFNAMEMLNSQSFLLGDEYDDEESNALIQLEKNCAFYLKVQQFLRSFGKHLNNDKNAIILSLPSLDLAKYEFKDVSGDVTNLFTSFSKETNNLKRNKDLRKEVMLKNAFELSKENQDPLCKNKSSSKIAIGNYTI